MSATFDYGPPRCIHDVIGETARRDPDAVALRFETEVLTYGELDRRANQVAHALRRRGVASGTPVGVSVERSVELVVGLLGVLKAGGHYVPIDPAYPEEQRLFVLGDTAAPVVLTQQAGTGLWPGGAADVLPLDDNREIQRMPDTPIGAASDPEALMYAMFTSGSTGRPKGVMVEHAGVFNRLCWMARAYGLDSDDVFLQKTPYNFDVSVWELFLPLMVGAPLVVARPGAHRDSGYLVDTIRRAGVTAVHFVPSMLRAFLDDPAAGTCTGLRNVFCSGEALSRATQDRFFETLPSVGLHNLYGPTEASIDVLAWTCRPDDRRSYVPIGTPIDNMQALVLDEDLNLAPAGETGELYLGGVGLARGYLNRPILTAEAFVPNPFDGSARSRLYRTGDLARQHDDGTVEFLGRRDHQVKLRGFRIELGEIESALNRHPAVAESVVTTEATGNEDVQQLVAYVLVADTAATPDRDALEAHAGSLLPAHMVPARYYAVGSFPVTANGKLDRAALRDAPDLRRLRGSTRPAATPEPADPALVDAVVAVWADVLAVPDVGLDDDFFELGGDSIVALELVTRMRRAGLRTTAKTVLDARTVRAVVARGSTGPAGGPTVDQGPVSGPAGLTPIQRWFFDKPLAAPHHWNMSLAVEALTPLDPIRLGDSLDRLVDHHDQLRARFRRDASGAWEQFVPPPGDRVPLQVDDLSGLPAAAQDEAALRLASEAQASLDLDHGLLVAARYVKLEPVQRDRLLLVFHHLVMDGVSWRIVLDDLARLYDGDSHLPEKTSAYRDWANGWPDVAHSDVLGPDVDHWSSPARPEPGPLPKDAIGWDVPTAAGTVTTGLDETSTDRLVRSAPLALDASTEEILLAALFHAVTRWSGRPRMYFDLEGHGREPLVDGLDVSRTVGWFTSIFPVEIAAPVLDATSTPSSVLPVVRDRLRAIPHRGVGYGILRHGRQLRPWPQAELKFNYLGRLDQTSAGGRFRMLPGSVGRDVDPSDPVSHSLDITARITDGQLSVDWAYSRAHDRHRIAALAQDFVVGLQDLLDGTDDPDDHDDGSFDVVDATGVGLDDGDLARIREALEVRVS